jgi:hypothetical protein
MRINRGLSTAGLSLAAAAFLAACGSSGPSGGTGTPSAGGGGGNPGGGTATGLDSCTILTQSVAASLSGDSTVAKVSGSTVGSLSMCIYTSPTATGGGAASITIESVPGGSALVNAAMQAAINQDAHGGNAQPVTGIGDTAFKVVSASDATIAFAKGGSFVVIGAGSITRSGASMETDLESLAHMVAGQVS